MEVTPAMNERLFMVRQSPRTGEDIVRSMW